MLTIGSGLAAGYVLTALFPANSLINTWALTLVDLGALQEGLALRVNAQFVIAAGFLLLVFALQHHGILQAARVQMIIGLAVLVPLLVVGIVPLLTGDLVLLLMSDYVLVLASSTVCYMIFTFLNLNSGWLHRVDSPHVPRPWRAPTALIVAAPCWPSSTPCCSAGVPTCRVRRAADRPGVRRSDRPGVLLPALRAGRGPVPGDDVRGPRAACRRLGRHPGTASRDAAVLVLAGGVAMVVIGQLIAAG